MKSYHTMPELGTTDFLNNEPGKLGTAPKFELPDEFKALWAPTNLSLEEINRRRLAVRQVQQENNSSTERLSYENTGAAATGHTYHSTPVPKNKKWYIYAVQANALSINTSGQSIVNWGIYPNSSATANRFGLTTFQLPTAQSGIPEPSVTNSVSFPIPIQVNEGEVLGLQYVNFQGASHLRIWYWEEDVGIV